MPQIQFQFRTVGRGKLWDQMRRIIVLLSCFLFLSLFVGCCSHSAVIKSSTDAQQAAQAEHANEVSVALVSDFGVADTHDAFCSGVWVANDVILTAAHCAEGYADMQHDYLVFKALREAGFPEPLAKLFANSSKSELMLAVRLGLIDEEIVANAFEVMESVPPVNPMTMDIPFLGPHQVVDIGVSPKKVYYGKMQVINKKADLALIRATSWPRHSVAHIADKAPEVGEELNFSGNPHNNFFSFRRLVVSSYRHSLKEAGMKIIDGPFMQVDGSMFHGDSGSGILNSRGELTGIASFVETDDELHIGFCIHVDTIRSLLIGQKIIKAKLDVQSKDPDLGDATINLE